MHGWVRKSALAICGMALLVLAGCAHVRPGAGQAGDAPGCSQETPEVFVLEGKINPALAACVAETFQASTREVILNSMGGDVAAALDIAGQFEGRRLTMRVRQRCHSSCANYFLPLAGRIVVEPGALIILHGSIDPWTVERTILPAQDGPDPSGPNAEGAAGRADGGARFEGFWRLAARQADFAARNRIPPGWLMYREAGSDGEIAGLTRRPTTPGRYLLVEEPMLRSCLPGVEIDPFQAELNRRWLRSIRRLGLMWSRTVPSGETVCSAPEN